MFPKSDQLNLHIHLEKCLFRSLEGQGILEGDWKNLLVTVRGDLQEQAGALAACHCPIVVLNARLTQSDLSAMLCSSFHEEMSSGSEKTAKIAASTPQLMLFTSLQRLSARTTTHINTHKRKKKGTNLGHMSWIFLKPS